MPHHSTFRGPPPVRTQLCLALAAFAAHLPAENWAIAGSSTQIPAAGNGKPTGNAVLWFASRFSGVDPQSALPCILELLTVMPQECNSSQIAVSGDWGDKGSGTDHTCERQLCGLWCQSGVNVG